MMGFLIKDILVMKKQLGFYLIFFVVYSSLAVTGAFPPSVLSGVVVVMGILLPTSACALDTATRWDLFAAATPAGRRGAVAGRYLFAVLTLAASGVLAGILYPLLALLGALEGGMAEAGLSLLGCLGVALVIDAVMLPLLAKYGPEKGRVVYLILLLATLGLSAALGQAISAGRLDGFSLPAWCAAALPGLLAILAVGGFIVSYFITQGIYEKKEF